ncbi:MAG: hypothetical protein COC10_06620 [Sphingobium sp.]|nr:MAG: hypothetical protein COC10_06620 [Sphingobium sp.]
MLIGGPATTSFFFFADAGVAAIIPAVATSTTPAVNIVSPRIAAPAPLFGRRKAGALSHHILPAP